eukprot:RCo010099
MIASTSRPPARPKRNAKVLIVDGEALHRAVTAQLLSHMGVVSEASAAGSEALAILRERHSEFFAVLMELRLPDQQGEQILSQIRDDMHLASLRAVATSAHVLHC